MSEFSALQFQPERYSDWLHIVCSTCYAYTVGDSDFVALQKNVFPEPGALAGRKIQEINFDDPKYEHEAPIVKYPGSDRQAARRWEIYTNEIIDCLQADGVEFTGDKPKKDLSGYPGALFVVAQKNYRSDFHLCRINPDGTYSDKTPERAPKLVRIGGKIVTEFDHESTLPSLRRNPYIFAGYIHVSRSLSCSIENGDPSHGLKQGTKETAFLAYSSGNTLAPAHLLRALEPHREAILARSYNGRVVVPMA